MRIWSLHPSCLDCKGLTAVWRETLLAKKVLEGKTKGYKNHPQLERFKKLKAPVEAVNQYLAEIFKEAAGRQYNFRKEKINWKFKPVVIPVTKDQLEFEFRHLLKKLRKRDHRKYKELMAKKTFKPHPLFKVTEGKIESWEKI